MHKQLFTLLSAVLLLSGCAGLNPKVQDVPDIAAPSARPERTLTSFSETLSCMDNLFTAYGVNQEQPVYLTTSGIPDDTGKVRLSSARNMFISTLSNMGARSDSFVFVDLPTLPDITATGNGTFDIGSLIAHINTILGGENIPYSDYYIIGSISQLDDNVLSKSSGWSFALSDWLDGGAGADRIASVVTLDMNVVDALKLQVKNGFTATNSITVMRQGKAGDLGGRIKKAGLTFSFALDKNEGMHQAIRTLVQLGTIELLGKLAQVPYWRCLNIETTNPEMLTQARNWYNDKSRQELVQFVQRTLQQRRYYGMPYYQGPVTGLLDTSTREAIGRYQTAMNQVPNGTVDFNLYRSLISDDLAQGRLPDSPLPPAPPTTTEALEIKLATVKGAEPVYRLNEKLEFFIKTNHDAYVYCYYRGGSGQISRVFPNEFIPNPYIPANTPLQLPHEDAPFSIVLDWPNVTEEVLCFATAEEVTPRLADALKAPDMRPLGAKSMAEVQQGFAGLDLENLVEKRLLVRVK